MDRGWVSPLFLPLLFLSPIIAAAADLDPEKDLQRRLEQSLAIIEKVKDSFQTGASTLPEIVRLKTLSADIRASHLLLQERFRLREEELKARGAKALARHRAMSGGYREALEEYLSLVDSLPPGEILSQTAIDRLQFLLTQTLPKKQSPILGTLPHRNLNYPSREPSSGPSIKPAYKGGNKTVTPEDLKSTAEAFLTKEVAELAQSLLWNPVSIYEWVKNNVETEWYWGCMKGEAETLRQRSGNDCDQAALLIALLRASGYPARYVRGVMEFFPDVERAKNLTGIEDPGKIAEYFQKAGVPFTPVIAGGKMANFQVEHIWVETQVPYANYRGAILDEHGKTWLGLDTSIKVKDYLYNNPVDILKDFPLTGMRDEYLGALQAQTPLEYIRTKIEANLSQTPNAPPATYNGLLRAKTLVPEVMNILPASMQYRQVKGNKE